MVPQAEELRTPPVYLWKTEVSASMVTEHGPMAAAALSWATELDGTLVYLTSSTLVVFLYLHDPSLAVYL